MTFYEELYQLRVKFLKDFDKYVRETIGDEDIIDYWLMYGILDASDDEDLRAIAENENQWLEMVEAFSHCVKLDRDNY